MPRKARKAPGGVIFHCINRSVGRERLFRNPQDYAGFEDVMAHALEAVPIRLLAYCLMPDHWHLILWPKQNGQLGKFMHRLTMTHTRRHQEHYRQIGHGPLYRGRFKSFPVQDDRHLIVVARYAERNPLRRGLVERAEQWPWSSLWQRTHPGEPKPGGSGGRRVIERCGLTLSPWPVKRPAHYVQWVNKPQPLAEEQAVQLSVTKGRPFGDAVWQARTTKRLGLESAFRPTGRPRKARPDARSEE
jgi:putative transposase